MHRYGNNPRVLTRTVGDAIRACTVRKKTVEVCFYLWCCSLVLFAVAIVSGLLYFFLLMVSLTVPPGVELVQSTP